MAVDAVKAGAASFLEKPFRPQELFDEIQKALRADDESWRHCDEEESIERETLACSRRANAKCSNLSRKEKPTRRSPRSWNLSVRGVEARRAKAMHKLRLNSKRELLALFRPAEEER